MQPFTRLNGVAAVFDQANVDTDQIIPARFLRKPRGPGYGGFLFHDLRFDEGGAERPDFPLNRPGWREAAILVAGENFGCGSSREAAVYALMDFGIRCVIAPSFADIFAANAVQNGLLCAALPAAEVAAIRDAVIAEPGAGLGVDLPAQTVTAPNGMVCTFAIDPYRKRCLIEGLDQIALTLARLDAIAEHERCAQAAEPWLRVTLVG
ncbi:MAG: 3-isopropylmalate dehydratase small subunit [Rhodospirillaceae bacterium]|nr:3-isopropylmalate dehydratase small subunit [Rhodospirillaceae bacterium]